MEGLRGAPPATIVCVTGATGYIGSWLVRSLLHRGYAVHATARDTGEAWKLLSSFGSHDQLKIFRADLREEGSFDAAVRGCAGVFHVAASMVFGVSDQENIEDRVRSQVIEPSVRGTINLLAACLRSGSVKRVVFTSSISTITAKDCRGGWKPVVDESCVNPVDLIWNTKPSGWVYVASKLLTEEKAFQFAKEKGIDLVSIIPPTVAGPFLTSGVPSSVQVLLSPITGDPKLLPILVAVQSRLGSIPLVHIEDICSAHIFLLENAAAEGRYICAAGTCALPRLIELLSSDFPSFREQRKFRYDEEFHHSAPSAISSKRLTDLGFKFAYGIRDIIKHSITTCNESGFLNHV